MFKRLKKIYREQPGELIFKAGAPYERLPAIKFGILFSMPLLRLLQRTRTKFSPIYLTLIGLFCNVIAGVSFATGHLAQGALLFFAALVFDLVDGPWARHTNKHVSLMKKFDPICDRIGKASCFGGLVYGQPETAVFVAYYYILELFAVYLLPNRFSNPRNWLSFSAWEASFLILFVAPILNMLHIFLPLSVGLLHISYLIKIIKGKYYE